MRILLMQPRISTDTDESLEKARADIKTKLETEGHKVLASEVVLKSIPLEYREEDMNIKVKDKFDKRFSPLILCITMLGVVDGVHFMVGSE